MKFYKLVVLAIAALVLNACATTQATTLENTEPKAAEIAPQAASEMTDLPVIVDSPTPKNKHPQIKLKRLFMTVQPYEMTYDLSNQILNPIKVRTTYDRHSKVLCTLDNLMEIKVEAHIETGSGPETSWFRTQACGTEGWITSESIEGEPLPSAEAATAPTGESMGTFTASSHQWGVFDPPSNVRVVPYGDVLCTVEEKQLIDVSGYVSIEQADGSSDIWRKTNACGSDGWIHGSQLQS